MPREHEVLNAKLAIRSAISRIATPCIHRADLIAPTESNPSYVYRIEMVADATPEERGEVEASFTEVYESLGSPDWLTLRVRAFESE